MRLLLDRHAAVDKKDVNGSTALMAASIPAQFGVAPELLTRGADMNATNNAGKTPVLAAIMSDQFGVAERLVTAGSDVNIAYANGGTPVIAALVDNRSNVIALLLRHGADPSRPHKNGLTPFITAVARNRLADGADVTAKDAQGLTALRIAKLRNYQGIAGLLKQRGSTVAARAQVLGAREVHANGYGTFGRNRPSRVCLGMELDPKYVDVNIQRWQELRGNQATIQGDGRSFEQARFGRLESSPKGELSLRQGGTSH